VTPVKDMDIPVIADDQCGSAMIIYLGKFITKQTDSGMIRSVPLLLIVIVGADIGIFMGALIGDIGNAVIVLRGWMLHYFYRSREPVIGEITKLII
jgi:hypothetical protein